MKKRVIVASILIAVLGGAFALRLINNYGVYFFDLIVAAVCVFCALEFSKLISANGVPASQMAAGIYPSLMFAGHMLFFVFELKPYFYAVIQLSILLATMLTTFIVYLCLKTKQVKTYCEENKINKLAYASRVALKSALTFVYPSCFLLALMLLNRIDAFSSSNVSLFKGNLGWVALIVTFLIPILTDTFAMLCGMLFKGPKLCPKISPNKTISGSICATILTSLVCGAFFYVFNAFGVIANGFSRLGIQVWHFVILGFVGAIVCQLGDLFESFIKRRAKVKDSGNVFPGHGGFLDRFDSHIFNAPFVLAFFIFAFII